MTFEALCLLRTVANGRGKKKQQSAVESHIYTREGEYLEATPGGNIITGFDNYTKGTSASAAAQRRRTGQSDNNRVFTKSSISYNANAADAAGGADGAAAGTPGAGSNPASYAPTPTSASFAREGGGGGGASAVGTPGGGAGGGRGGAGNKKGKKVDDGEGDEVGVKDGKKRTNFGASRKG